jgi:hypothetical protein
MNVHHDHRPVLYKADGTALVRTAGFTKGGQMGQTSQTFPQLTKGGKTIGGKKSGKKGC